MWITPGLSSSIHLCLVIFKVFPWNAERLGHGKHTTSVRNDFFPDTTTEEGGSFLLWPSQHFSTSFGIAVRGCVTDKTIIRDGKNNGQAKTSPTLASNKTEEFLSRVGNVRVMTGGQATIGEPTGKKPLITAEAPPAPGVPAHQGRGDAGGAKQQI